MKETASKTVLLALDFIAIFLSLLIAYGLRVAFSEYFSTLHIQALSSYLSFSLMYAVTLIMLAYEGVYTRRYDFWHESRNIIKALSFAFFIVLAYLAMTKTIGSVSRAVIVVAFLIMAVMMPLFKNIAKKKLFRMGLWGREAKVYGNDPFIVQEIFNNPYLGYVEAKGKEPKTAFVNSRGTDAFELRRIIDKEIRNRHEVVFIPLMDEYDLTQSHIYELSNTRTNLVVFQNRLKSKYRILMKQLSDIGMFIIAFPLILPILIIISFLIKREDFKGSVLFKQERMGKDDQSFVCYKFRTMYEESDDILQEYLDVHPEEVENYEKYHKYENDPRVTKVGEFLRKTSLDELPQIFNVLKNEMSFVGPRPYMLNEKAKIGNKLETILAVRPGITGLWQVSGRSDVNFHDRVDLDVWYIRNWNLWMDLVILIKTVRSVLIKEGAS